MGLTITLTNISPVNLVCVHWACSSCSTQRTVSEIWLFVFLPLFLLKESFRITFSFLTWLLALRRRLPPSQILPSFIPCTGAAGQYNATSAPHYCQIACHSRGNQTDHGGNFLGELQGGGKWWKMHHTNHKSVEPQNPSRSPEGWNLSPWSPLELRFPWNKGISLPQLPFGVRSCEAAIIWPEWWYTIC